MAISCTFDQKTKKLYILFFGLIISYIPIIIFQNSDYFKNICAFEKLTRAISKIIVIIPYFINKLFCNKTSGNNNKQNFIFKNNIKDYIILICYPVLYFLSKLFITLFKETYEFINQSLTLIFLSFLMKFYTEFKFYNYNIISVIMFTIFAITIEVLIYKQTFNFEIILLYILLSILYSVDLNYRKYLMDKKYISLYKIISFCGIIDFIILTILEIFTIKYENSLFFNGKKIKIPIQYKEIETSYFIIIAGSIPIFICYSIHIIIFYLLIYNFTPIHAVVIDTIIISIQSIYTFQFKDDAYIFIILILLIIFSILSLFIYLEIIELKCCGLNKNIRKNILKRMDTDRLFYDIEEGMDNDIENKKIDMDNGYIIELERTESAQLTNEIEEEEMENNDENKQISK